MISWKKVFHFWESLGDLQQTELLDNTIIRQYGNGERIQKRQGLYLVSDGGINLYMIHPNGKKRVLLSANDLDVIILTADFLKASYAVSFELRASKDSEIYFISEEYWERCQENNRDIRKYTIELLSKHLIALSNHLYEGMENIGKQLAIFLLRSIEEKGNNCIEISHEELAETLGTSREVVTRNLSILKNLGFIETGRNKIRVYSPEKLEEYVNKQPD